MVVASFPKCPTISSSCKSVASVEVAMRHVPRFAVGTIQPGANREMAVWGLVAALAETEDSPILVRSSFDLGSPDAARPIIGRASRHLDSWAMSRSDAISALARAATERDTAIVEGAFDSGITGHSSTHHSLDRLCEWLDLPRIAIVDVLKLANCGLMPSHAK